MLHHVIHPISHVVYLSLSNFDLNLVHYSGILCLPNCNCKVHILAHDHLDGLNLSPTVCSRKNLHTAVEQYDRIAHCNVVPDVALFFLGVPRMDDSTLNSALAWTDQQRCESNFVEKSG